MSEWKKYKLGELVQTNKKSIDSNYPFEEIEYLDTGSITRGKIESFQKYKLSEAPSRAKRLVVQDDIIYSTVRPIQRHYGFIDNPLSNLVVSTGFATITCEKDKLNPKFLYYLLSNDDTVEYLDVIAEASTSAYPSLRPSDIENLEIAIPGLPEQKSIASILSSLDDKIDLLHCQNATLEKIAETLFRQWFVEDAKEEWECYKLKDLVKHVKPGTNFQPKRIEYGIPFLNVRNLNNGFIDLSDTTKISKEEYQRVHKNWEPEENDILISRIGTLGIVAVIQGSDLPVAVHYNMINLKAKTISYQFLYFLLKSQLFKEKYFSNVRQSVQEYVTIEDTENVEISLPIGTDLFKEHEIAFNELFNKIKSNQTQIRTLTALRDTLLPKLMSGEIRVL